MTGSEVTLYHIAIMMCPSYRFCVKDFCTFDTATTSWVQLLCSPMQQCSIRQNADLVSSQFRSCSALAVTFFSNCARNPTPQAVFAQETPIQDHMTLVLLLLIVKQVRLVMSCWHEYVFTYYTSKWNAGIDKEPFSLLHFGLAVGHLEAGLLYSFY